MRLVVFVLLAYLAAAAPEEPPVLLFMESEDAAPPTWGLIQSFYNVAELQRTRIAPSGASDALLVRAINDSSVELFFVRTPCVFRTVSSDGLVTWTEPVVVINGTVAEGNVPWFQNAQNMGYRADTGEYLTLIYGGKAVDFPGSPFKSHGALGFILRSNDGIHWTCDNGLPDGSCNLSHPTTIDHDDGSMTWDHDSARWVNAQIVIQATPPPTLPSGLSLPDNSNGRRLVAFRSSPDGRNWTCAPSFLTGGNPMCPEVMGPNDPVVFPDPTLDPPELQHYRCRPFRYHDRWVAAVYNYAPSPLCSMNVSHCHGPHMGTSWWANKGAIDDAKAWRGVGGQPYRWQRFWRHSRVLGPHQTLNHAPLSLNGTLLWLSRGAWYGVGLYRLGGLYSPANAQFLTPSVVIPGGVSALALEVDAQWQVAADACDPLRELCQAYVMVELLDATTAAVVPGYEAGKCVVAGIDAVGEVLRWKQADGSLKTTTTLQGKMVQARITMRDSIVYALRFVSESESELQLM